MAYHYCSLCRYQNQRSKSVRLYKNPDSPICTVTLRLQFRIGILILLIFKRLLINTTVEYPALSLTSRRFYVHGPLDGDKEYRTIVGIQNILYKVEIPEFDFPNRFSGLTTSFFSRITIRNLIFDKFK
jgi:hypothetical protein